MPRVASRVLLPPPSCFKLTGYGWTLLGFRWPQCREAIDEFVHFSRSIDKIEPQMVLRTVGAMVVHTVWPAGMFIGFTNIAQRFGAPRNYLGNLLQALTRTRLREAIAR